MSKVNTRFITRTAILLALTVVFQTMGRFMPLGPNNNFIVGPLVNACLLISVAMVGLPAASIIAATAPFGAIFTGAAVPLPFIPCIAIGNLMIVLGFFMLIKKSPIGGVILGSIMKFGFLYASIVIFLRIVQVPAKLSKNMLWLFSWPQLATALIGGAIALIVIRMLKKAVT